MDEVIFRSSQKFENLQVQLEVASEQGKILFRHFSQQIKSILLRMWHSPSSIHVQGSFKQVWIYFLTVANKLKQEVVVYGNNFYENLVYIFGQRWSRQNIYFGCVGFILGGLVGFGIGLAVHKRQAVVRYMQAIQCVRYGGIEAATVVEDAIAPHECGLNDVLVDVKAGSLQIIDAQICSGYGHKIRRLLNRYQRLSNHDLPTTLGRDCTGVIMDIGKKVDRLEVGDEVWLTVPFWAPGTLSQSVLVHENKVARKPKTIGYEAACSLPYAGSIALSALIDCNLSANNCENKRIFVQDGCSPVGCVLIQILSQWKAHITTTCFKRAVPVAQALGAHDVICLSEQENKMVQSSPKVDNEVDISKALPKEFEVRDKFDVVIITGNNGLSRKEMQLYCGTNGRVISTLPPILYSDSFGFTLGFLFGFYVRTKLFFQNLFGSEFDYFGETHMCFISLDKLTELVDHGHLQTVVDKVVHPSDIELALRHIQSSQSIGSTIISFR